METRLLKSATLFPGQGAFDGPALIDAAERHPEIAEVFSEIDTVAVAEFGRGISHIVLGEEPATIEKLLAEDLWVSQFAIFGVDVAAFRILAAAGFRPDVLAGHSLGEIAALVCAGAYSAADGARVIVQRVRAVEAVDLRGGYMGALSAPADRVRLLVDLVADDSLAVAVENHRGQTIVSGSADAMDRVRQIARALNVAFARLDSTVPFHCPLLAPAVEQFAKAVRHIPVRSLDVPVYSAVSGRYYSDEDDLPALLAGHFVEPVRFADAVQDLHDGGVEAFVECGALETLSKLVGRVLDTDPPVVPVLAGGGRPVEAATARLRALGLLSPVLAAPASLIPEADPAEFAAFWAERGGVILDLVRQEFAEYRGPSASTGPPPAVPESAGGADGPPETLAEDLRRLYAEALEYPEEVFTDEVLLEGELGIDSVKQVELLTRVSERYGLPVQQEGFRLGEYNTMGRVVEYVHTRIEKHGTTVSV